MPYVSQAQRAYMHIHHPQIASEFDAATPKGTKLPQHVKKQKAADDLAALTVHSQQFMPTQHRRALTDEEHADIHRGEKQWLPSVFQSYGTPLPSMLASPWKQGLLAGLAGAGVGGLAGGSIGASATKSPWGAGIGALVGAAGLGGTAGLVQGLSRSARNEGIVEMMKRLPEHAVKRDLLSDPAYQADVKRDNDNDNLTKLMAMMQTGNLMSPGSLSMGKFSFEALGQKAAELMPSICPIPGCTTESPCDACKKEEKVANAFAGDAARLASMPIVSHPLMGAGVGAVAGGLTSPHGHHTEGVGRGLIRGGTTGLGALLGSVLGAGASFAAGVGNLDPSEMRTPATIGGLAGGAAGYLAGGKLLGDPSWEKEKQANQLPITPQPLSAAPSHDPFGISGTPRLNPGPVAHPGPGAGPDPFHVLGGQAAQHGVGGAEFTGRMAAGDPFGTNGIPNAGDPFQVHAPAAGQSSFGSGIWNHIRQHPVAYGLGGAALGAAALYHLTNRKRENRQPQFA